MIDILYPMVRIAVFFLGLSISLAILITTTIYCVKMFQALPFLMIVGLFAILLVLLFFAEGAK